MMVATPHGRTRSGLRGRQGVLMIQKKGGGMKLEMARDHEISHAGTNPDSSSAEDGQVENTPYVYKLLAGSRTTRIFQPYAGTGDDLLRGELLCTELGESTVTCADQHQLQQGLKRYKERLSRHEKSTSPIWLRRRHREHVRLPESCIFPFISSRSTDATAHPKSQMSASRYGLTYRLLWTCNNSQSSLNKLVSH